MVMTILLHILKVLIKGCTEISLKMCYIRRITSANCTHEKKKCAGAHSKFFKSKPFCFFFLERDELSMNLGKTLDRLATASH